MFFLYDMFHDGNSISSTGADFNINTLKISNGIFDHLSLIGKIEQIYAYNLPTEDIDTTKPETWGFNTILNANFNNTLDGGNISQFIGNIDYLAVQRKEAGSNDWVTIRKIYKNVSNNQIVTEFTMNDNYAQNGVQYTYQIVPVDIYGNVGVAFQQDVVSLFNDAYIADGSHIYKITYNYNLSSQRNQKSALYEPYGSKYPFVAYNATTDYDSGSITAILLAPTTQSNTKAYLDRMAQTKLVEEFNSWLTNGKAKILKDFNGRLKVITIYNAISNSYYKELGNGLASTSFNFVEVGDMKQIYLDRLGLSNVPIIEK